MNARALVSGSIFLLNIFEFLTLLHGFENSSNYVRHTYLGQFKAWNGKAFETTNYYASQTSGTWVAGIQDCGAIFGGNASLLSLETKEEQDWINSYLTSRGVRAGMYWTSGLYDLTHGVWRWVADEEAVFDDYTNWGVGEPRSLNSRQRVVVNFKTTETFWEAHDDTVLNRMICEVPVVIEEPIEGEPVTCYEPESLMIVLDSTTNINYDEVKSFASKLAYAFTEPVGRKIGFISYSLFPTNEIHPSQSLHPVLIEECFRNSLHQNYTSRHTSDAILNAMKQIQEYSPDLPMRMVVITSGMSERPAKTKEIASLANAAGIRTFAVGVSFQDPGNELINIAGGHADRVFQAEYEDLNGILLRLSESVCSID